VEADVVVVAEEVEERVDVEELTREAPKPSLVVRAPPGVALFDRKELEVTVRGAAGAVAVRPRAGTDFVPCGDVVEGLSHVSKKSSSPCCRAGVTLCRSSKPSM